MPDRVDGVDCSLTIQLLRTREALIQHFRPMFQSLDITEQQWRVLRSLYPDRECDASHLAHDAAVLPSSLTRIVKKLEAEGMVCTQHPDVDRRRINISLTKNGKEFMAQALPESQRIYAVIREAIGDKRMDALFDLLDETSRSCEGLQIPPRPSRGN